MCYGLWSYLLSLSQPPPRLAPVAAAPVSASSLRRRRGGRSDVETSSEPDAESAGALRTGRSPLLLATAPSGTASPVLLWLGGPVWASPPAVGLNCAAWHSVARAPGYSHSTGSPPRLAHVPFAHPLHSGGSSEGQIPSEPASESAGTPCPSLSLLHFTADPLETVSPSRPRTCCTASASSPNAHIEAFNWRLSARETVGTRSAGSPPRRAHVSAAQDAPLSARCRRSSKSGGQATAESAARVAGASRAVRPLLHLTTVPRIAASPSPLWPSGPV